MLGSEGLARLRAELVADRQVPVVSVCDGRVHDINDAARAMFTRTRIGDELRDMFDERSMAKLAEVLRTSDAGGTPELQVRREIGPPLAVRFLVLSASGEQLFIAQPAAGHWEAMAEELMAANSALANLTRELSRRTRDLDAATESLQRQAELRELFIAALAHDLRAPLSTILLTEATMRQRAAGGQPIDTERHIACVERSAGRMLRLIDSLLLTARLDATEPAPTRESFEQVRVDEIARRVADDLTPLAHDAHVAIAVTAPTPVCAPANASWVEQVMANLLTNAIRHSPPGASVEVTIALEGQEAVCTVADRGPGVPTADRERIFERFVQRGERRGTVGLGLYVCRRIVLLHGGRLGVEPNPGGGARFAFRLPRATCAS